MSIEKIKSNRNPDQRTLPVIGTAALQVTTIPTWKAAGQLTRMPGGTSRQNASHRNLLILLVRLHRQRAKQCRRQHKYMHKICTPNGFQVPYARNLSGSPLLALIAEGWPIHTTLVANTAAVPSQTREHSYRDCNAVTPARPACHHHTAAPPSWGTAPA